MNLFKKVTPTTMLPYEKDGSITMDNVYTEAELTELTGLKKAQISVLRLKKGLPYIRLHNRSRLYFEADLIEFFQKQRRSHMRDAF